MATTTAHQNINQTVEPMTRFSINEDDDVIDNTPLRFKRQRFCAQTASQSQPPPTEEEIEELESDLILLEQADDDEDEEDEDEDDEEDDVEEEDDVTENIDIVDATDAVTLRYQRQLMTSTAAAASSNQRSPVRTFVTLSPMFDNASEALQVVLTDPDVLDCPICLDPLRTPVFQCENGHTACSSCCSKVRRKCPSCCMPIGYNRCRAIEKVIESVQVSCKNARHGCKKTMTYSKKNEHEQICPHTKCFCPHPSCPFVGSSKSLYLHFGIQHAASTTRFTYNTTFTLRVELNQTHISLQEQHESVIFILNHELKEHGRVFNVDCVGPSTFKTSFEYQLTAKNTETSLSIQSVPEIYSNWSEHTLKKSYLTVPSDFLGYNGNLSLCVCIKKVILPA